ncbi:LigA protein [Streptomyces himastatinicus ATCC 53653]|uniref:LigA protein n=1 Tax=Streptomyces himastatinicus ATCC 53653 TaxID=457427 RepID=D9WWW4_9ACTN|nr:LigA protein [Streptomyces himastatinicus ATCC 53653]
MVAGIAAAVIAVKSLADMGEEAPPNVDKLTTSLGNLGRTGKTSGEAARVFGKDLSGLRDSVKALTDPSTTDAVQQKLVKALSLGNWDSTPVQEAKEKFDAIDKALSNLVRGGKADVAAAALKRLESAYVKNGGSAGDFRKRLDDYKSALADQKFEQEMAAQSMGLFGKAAQETQAKLDAQKQSADGLRQSIQALNDVNRQGADAMNKFEQSIDDSAKAAKDNAGSLKMHRGELDLNSQKARDAESALRDLATNTDDAATKAREQGKSWEYVQGILSRGQSAFVETAQKMGLTKEQAQALAKSYLDIPSSKSTKIEMKAEDAIAGLDSVIAAIKATPNAKSVTVDALTSDAVNLLESLGFKVTHLKDGRFKVTAETGSVKGKLSEVEKARSGLKNKTLKIDAKTAGAIRDLENLKTAVRGSKGKTITMKVPTAEGRRQLQLLGFKIKDTKGKRVTVSVPTGTPRSQVAAIRAAIAALKDKSVTITTKHVDVFQVRGTAKSAAAGIAAQARNLKKADGGLVDYYANGGIQRRGVRHFADGAERHVAEIAPAGAWRMWAEPETGGEAYIPLAPTKRLRSRAIAEETIRRLGGDPQTIEWHANGSITDWRYDPQTGSLYSASDAGQAGHKTRKVKTKKGTKEVEYFSLDAVEGKLMKSARAARAWNKDLSTVADRVGADVAQALAGMGEDGVALTRKMAHGSKRYIELMARQLRDLAKTAKASLTDYTRQMEKASSSNTKFQADLAKLAGAGFGDLAAQLAAQGDQAAIDIASSAVKDRGRAKKANDAAKRANNALTNEQVAEMVQIIAAITSSKVGIHSVAEKTGIGEDEIVTVATKAKGQISSALGGRAAQFLSDLTRAQKGLSYANGGIRSGIYATRGGAVTFAEPSTGGEAYIPLGANKRRNATAVLGDVAGRFGLGLTDASAGGRVVIIREQGPLVGNQTWHVTSGGNAIDTARRIDADNSYQLRRLARGGVGAR